MRPADLLVNGIPIYKDPAVPLQRRNELTGEYEDALCWTFRCVWAEWMILVHPDRWDLFTEMLAKEIAERIPRMARDFAVPSFLDDVSFSFFESAWPDPEKKS